MPYSKGISPVQRTFLSPEAPPWAERIRTVSHEARQQARKVRSNRKECVGRPLFTTKGDGITVRRDRLRGRRETDGRGS